MAKKLFIQTHGCQMNEYDSSRMADLLGEHQALEITEKAEEADVILLNTCSIREKAQEKVFSELGAWRVLKQQNLDLVINFDIPRRGDEYVHRIGRTGRAGAGGTAISLVGHGDWNLMSSIERYLKLRFELRTIKELKGTYKGPKKVKASGKAAGTKKKKDDAKKTGSKSPAKKKPAAKPRPGPSKVVSQDGLAPLKRKKPAAE